MVSLLTDWLERFHEEPQNALDDLLFRRLPLGEWSRNETTVLFYQIFNKRPDIHEALDQAFFAWWQQHEGQHPKSHSSVGWSHILRSALSVIDYFHLEATTGYLRKHREGLRPWLRGLYISPARDPEAALLQLLANHQKNWTLLPLWMRLCRLEEELPLHYASLGILGLHKLPEANGKGLPEPFFHGLVALAEACVEQGHEKHGKKLLQREAKALLALHPDERAWFSHLIPALRRFPLESDEVSWFADFLPDLKNKLASPNRSGHSIRRPPSRQDRENILRRIKREPWRRVRSDLLAFLERYRRYTEATGNSSFLGKTFCNLAGKTQAKEPDLASGLAEEVRFWEPYNPYSWTVLAKVESFRGNLVYAEELLWQARRRFPEELP